MTIIRKSVYSRAGLMGNPSDGYNGKTIAFLVRNFAAEVTLWQSPDLEVLPCKQDHSKFKGMDHSREDAKKHGYYGGVRLVRAAINKFREYTIETNAEPQKKKFNENFTIRYESTIPRQVGLAGSSAIVTATFRALMQFYGVDINSSILANLVLDTEKEELRIEAGLQDRVVQAFGGMVYMDFSEEAFRTNSRRYGIYERMNPDLLPDMFLVYDVNPLKPDSGKILDTVRSKYEEGDIEVIQAMQTFADLTVQARGALESKDHKKLAKLINSNFDLRRKIFRDELIGERNLRMIKLARECTSCAKFSGSGGAVIGIYESDGQFAELEKAFNRDGYKLVKVEK